MRQHVQAHHIGQAEGAGARPANGRAGQRVHLFDGQAFVLHQAKRLQHDEDADAVGDEVRRVAGEDHFLAETLVGETRATPSRGRIGFRRGNDLHQPHIARRIEEVGAEPAAAQIARHHAGDGSDWKAAGVGGQDGVAFQMGRDARQQGLFDVQIFGDGFDDPVAVRSWARSIVEVAEAILRGGAGA